MSLITLTISEADYPFLMEAIGLRAMSLQDELRRQIVQQKVEQEERRRAKIAETTKAQIAHADAVTEEPKPSLNERRAALKKLLSTKEGKSLSIAEIARRTGVSYVTARKATITKRKN